MMKSIHFVSRYSMALALLTGLFACEKGDEKANLAPSTEIAISAINLSGENRLTSSVQLDWTGYDKDGYVTGFEISLDNVNWNFTTKTDSLFRFNFTGVTDTTDISFYVRAVDDDRSADATPAFLKIPIQNTPPVARFDSSVVQPSDTIFSVLTAAWVATDADGQQTLDSVFIKINNGAWYPLAPNVSTVSFVPETPEQNGACNSIVYKGFNAEKMSKRIGGLVVGDTNRIYIKARDIANSESIIRKTKAFFVKRKTSDLLVVDTHIGSVTPTPESIYFPILNTVYPAGFDRIDMTRNAGENQPRLWNTTFPLILGLYKKVFWYSDDQKNAVADRNLMLIEAASAAVQKYLNTGGKVLITSKFPDGVARLSRDSQVFSWLPMDSIPQASSELRLLGNRVIPAVLGTGYEDLRTPVGSIISGFDPFSTSSPDTLYRAISLGRTVGTWTGTTKIAARKTYSNGRTNLVFFSAEMHLLNGNPTALSNTFSKILNDEFNWIP